MKRVASTIACLVAISIFVMPAFGAPVTGFDIPQSGSGYTSISPIASAPELAVTPLSMVGVTPTTFDNHFYANNWGTTVNLAKYYETTITIDSGFQLNLGDLTFSVEDLSGPAVSTFEVRSSLDGFATTIDSMLLANTTGDVVDGNFDLSSLGDITGGVTFRFYGTTNSVSRSLGFANHFPGAAGGGFPDVGQNIRFDGSLSAVPEPTSIALWGIGTLGIAVAARRRRKRKQAAV